MFGHDEYEHLGHVIEREVRRGRGEEHEGEDRLKAAEAAGLHEGPVEFHGSRHPAYLR